MTERRKTQRAPAYLKYERARNRANMPERFLLGCAIQDRTGFTAADMVAAYKDCDFVDPLHRAVLQAIRALLERGARDLDVALVCSELQRQGTFTQFERVTSYLCSLTEGCVPAPTRESRIFRLLELGRAWADLERAKKEAVSA